jgi:AAA15 family ATPase/GTPase
MLIDFEVGNFLSFGKPVRFSMGAANPIKEYEENVFEAGKFRLLKSAAIYGANASGKSNLLSAMIGMRWLVLNSSKETQAGEEIDVVPFRLDDDLVKSPSHFEVVFLSGGIRYRYGFEADRKAVRKEWLLVSEKLKESLLFFREGDGIELTERFQEGTDIETKTRDNALFISVVAQFNGKISKAILDWFKSFRPLHGLMEMRHQNLSIQMLEDEKLHNRLVEFIKKADMGIEDIITVDMQMSDEEINKYPAEIQTKIRGDIQNKKFKRILSIHSKFKNAEKTGKTAFDFFQDESEGIKKLFLMAAPILDSLRNGHIVSIDELDAKMHPLLTKSIIRLFNSKETNPNNAQLIFAVHDTNLLNYGNLRRDQIWFVEKNQKSETDLYSLAEFKLQDGKKIRNDEEFERNYIRGRYGAVPYIGNFGELFKETGNGKTD